MLWELQQLDTDDRRGRVTVVFDEQAIHIKDMQLGFQHKMHDESPGKVIWSGKRRAAARTQCGGSARSARTEVPADHSGRV